MATNRTSDIPPKAPVYMDVLGRVWTVQKLDALLAMPSVLVKVNAGHRHSLTRGGKLEPGACYSWCLRLYKREAAAALLHLLVVRRQDLGARP